VGADYGNSGATFICLSTYGTGETWSAAPPLYGVTNVGGLCTDGWLAQSTDGYPMMCNQGRWAVYLSDVA